MSLEVFIANNPGYAPVDLDPAKLEYREWTAESGAVQTHFFSTVLKGTQTLSGITRTIDEDGWITEYQTLDGKLHGYYR